MSENNNQNTQQQTTTPTPEATGDQAGAKMFTQEEVNRIVSDRLARERAKSEPSPLDEREQAIKAREAKFDCREYIKSSGLPESLLDVFDTSDAETFKKNVEKLDKAINLSQMLKAPNFVPTFTGPCENLTAWPSMWEIHQ